MHFYQKVWHEFCAEGKTLPALKRNYPEWHKHRERYFLWAIDIDSADIIARLHRAKRLLEPYLVLPYIRQPHITLCVCGFIGDKLMLDDDFSWQLLGRQIADIDDLQLRSFDVLLGSVNSFQSAPFVEVEDKSGTLGIIRNTLNRAKPEMRTSRYVPHVTLGIYNNEYPVNEIADLIGKIPSFRGFTLPVSRLSVMSYSAEDIGSRLRIEHEILLR